MPIKPLTHLRPLLRLPTSHQPSPEHFSSNPSLLHHLSSSPNQGLSLAGQHAPSSGSAGGSSGAGKAGWGNSGAGAGSGGYTGHGRAFLSLPHTGIVDPSSSITSSPSDDQQRKSSPQAGLLLKHRLARQTRIVQLEEHARKVHREIEARAGSNSRIGVIDLDEFSPPLRQSSLVDTLPEPELSSHSSRLTFPPPVAGPSTPPRHRTPTLQSPSHSRSSTPSQSRSSSRPNALHRSQSSIDLWHVGVPRRMSLRALSTTPEPPLPTEDRNDALDLSVACKDSSEPSRPSTRPTRHLMDLAGADSHRSRPDRTFVRRNSTAYMPQSEPDGSAVEADVSEEHTDRSSSQLSAFIAELENADASVDRVNRLISYFRSKRTPEVLRSQFPDLAEELPLPQRHPRTIYNACLRRMLALRRPGQSISEIVDVYNEMLANHCRPDNRTYVFLFRAFTERAIDVSRAISSWESTKAWEVWCSETFGTELDTAAHKAKDATIQAYRSETNISNACKLVKAIELLGERRNTRRKGDDRPLGMFSYETFQSFLLACSVSSISPQDLEIIKEVYMQQQQGDETINYARVVRFVAVLQQANDLQGVSDLWNLVLQQSGSPRDQDAPEGPKFATYVRAAEAFISLGEIDKGLSILNSVVDDVRAGKYDSADVMTRVSTSLEALVKQNRLDDLLSVHNRFVGAVRSRPEASDSIRTYPNAGLVDALVIRGHWRVAYDLLASFFDGQITSAESPTLPPIHRSRLYAGILRDISQNRVDEGSVVELLEKCAKVARAGSRPLPQDDDVFRLHLQVLIKYDRIDLLPDLFANFVRKRTPTAEHFADLAAIIPLLIQTDSLHIRHVLQIRSAMGKFFSGRQLTPEDALAIGLRYLDGRRKASHLSEVVKTAEQWSSLIEMVLRYSPNEPEMDEVLLQMVEDMQSNLDFASNISNTSPSRQLVERLIHRFGEERGKELTLMAFGQELGSEQLNIWTAMRPLPVPPLSLDGTSAESAESGTTDSQPFRPIRNDMPPMDTNHFTLPPPPEYVDSLPKLSPVGRNFWFSESLSKSIDNQYATSIKSRKPVNTDAIFNQVVNELQQNSKVPGVYTLGKLIENLCRVDSNNPEARQQADLRVRQIYALAQASLQGASPSSRGPWLALENAMIIACCNLGHLEEAGLHRARIIQNGMTPSADAYATMIASAKDTTDDATVATQLWEECQHFGVAPNLYLYNTIISKLSKARKAEAALALFQEMKDKRITPSSVTYGAVINACCRVGDGQSAATLFNEMASQRNFKPRVPPFNTMMQYHLTTSPNRDAVLHYYNGLVSTGVPPSSHTYKLLLDAFAVLPPIDIQSLERIFNELVADRRVPVQGTHWASLITAHGIYNADPDKALAIFRSISAHPTAAVNLGTEPVVWEAILNVTSQQASVDQMEQLHREMIESGAQATAYVYNILIGGYARAGQIDNARSVFNSMGDSVSGVAAPNNHPQLLTSSGHVKPSTITDQPTHVVYREPSTYEAMIRAELSNGTRENAESVLRMMEARCYPVAVFMRAEHLISDHNVSVPWHRPS
ncbi:hypothetical protein BD324DRAFT_628072 [Kockovaella imperatae]|uniref:Pentacotripeptide-repeat region of PRORP domain-containing protein n=1 Tax=Kockovaella imperatae TaxID=4999 RepID=A0A1Y1UFH2_9TREE|nr:hypothetical protein BD324DRAFT_628072 [Kockovaella imperatae]ORX36254.1 hypothetical protein BD324DRAFT_628072 [Kockovaella imperatae]